MALLLAEARDETRRLLDVHLGRPAIRPREHLGLVEGLLGESELPAIDQGLGTERKHERAAGHLRPQLVDCGQRRTRPPALEMVEDALGPTQAVGRGVLVYGGEAPQRRSKADVVPWHALSEVNWFAQ